MHVNSEFSAAARVLLGRKEEEEEEEARGTRGRRASRDRSIVKERDRGRAMEKNRKRTSHRRARVDLWYAHLSRIRR